MMTDRGSDYDNLYEILKVITSILIVVIFAATVDVTMYWKPNTSELTSTPNPVEPMYYNEIDHLVSYPNSAFTYLLKNQEGTFMVFSMDTEGSPIVMKQRIDPKFVYPGECE